jgi:hypothetical protein
VRTRIGGFHLSEAFDPAVHGGEIIEAIQPTGKRVFDALGLPYIDADPDQVRKITHGQALDGLISIWLAKDLLKAAVLGVFGKINEKDELVAVLEQKNGNWGYGHVFAAR